MKVDDVDWIEHVTKYGNESDGQNEEYKEDQKKLKVCDARKKKWIDDIRGSG